MPESFFFVSNFVTIHKGLTGDLKNTDISFTVVICGWAPLFQGEGRLGKCRLSCDSNFE